LVILIKPQVASLQLVLTGADAGLGVGAGFGAGAGAGPAWLCMKGERPV
jgi:hypothetical protein